MKPTKRYAVTTANKRIKCKWDGYITNTKIMILTEMTDSTIMMTE